MRVAVGMCCSDMSWRVRVVSWEASCDSVGSRAEAEHV
jgi:hypothetical protein